ncbi:hypothetical protein KC329_g59 [Hortaea werneckii]|nr:hypothetical protein KC329_g59 [Hortaea werneckii]
MSRVSPPRDLYYLRMQQQTGATAISRDRSFFRERGASPARPKTPEMQKLNQMNRSQRRTYDVSRVRLSTIRLPASLPAAPMTRTRSDRRSSMNSSAKLTHKHVRSAN